MTGWLFALGGAFAGAAQAVLLARAAQGIATPLSFLFRLLLVVGVLILAARAGYLLFGAAGWFTGFVVSAAILFRSLR